MLTQETMNQAINANTIKDLERISQRSPRPMRQAINDGFSAIGRAFNIADSALEMAQLALIEPKRDMLKDVYASILADTTAPIQGA